VDLERDLDAVERTGYHHGGLVSSDKGTGGAGGLKNGVSSANDACGGEDVMEEGDEEDDD
jgi:hypothetical protein